MPAVRAATVCHRSAILRVPLSFHVRVRGSRNLRMRAPPACLVYDQVLLCTKKGEKGHRGEVETARGIVRTAFPLFSRRISFFFSFATNRSVSSNTLLMTVVQESWESEGNIAVV